nr:FeoB-associated Cys-rich membrane protein [Thaumasiovibrio occultus]
MTNIVVGLSIVAILGIAIAKLVVMKRKGGGCVGCAEKGSCSAKPTSKCN